jgi:antitoxin VapB
VSEGQAYAWNPSITGVKIEDTILVGLTANEVLTEMPDWPAIEAEVDGRRYRRPAILER